MRKKMQEKSPNKNYKHTKDSRWDKICKKHLSNVNLTTATVKKLFDMNFVDEKQLKSMTADPIKVLLDPVQIMNCRHEMVKQKNKYRLENPVQVKQVTNGHAPHELIEAHLIDKELTKFKEAIEASRSQKSKDNGKNKLYINLPSNLINNESLFQTLEESKNITNGFYSKIIEASDSYERLDPLPRSVRFNEDHLYDEQMPDTTSNCCYQTHDVIELMTDDFLKVTRYEQYFHSEETDIQRDYGELEEVVPAGTVQIMESQNENEFQESITHIKSMSGTNSDTLFHVKQIDIARKDFSQLIIRNFSHDQEPEERQFNVGEKKCLTNYLQKWKNYTVIAKITKNSVNNVEKVTKINQFLNKVRLNQQNNKMGRAVDAANKHLSKELKKNYEHKLKIQQDIIELQKLKLERQERMITELKISKIADTSKTSKAEIKNELYQAIKRGNVKLRGKAKCIQISGNIRDEREDEDEEKRKILAQGLVVPQFLAKMQSRSLERASKHEEAKERRLQLEKEKENAKLAAEEARRLEDEQSRRKRIEELRDKRKLEKQQKIQRDKDHHRFLEGSKKAKIFYHRKLLEKGLKGFRQLMKAKRANERRAVVFNRRFLIRAHFGYWRWHVKQIWDEKRTRSAEVYQAGLIRKHFGRWKELHIYYKSKFLVARDWYELKITEKIFIAWNEVRERSKKIEANKLRTAQLHYNWQLKWKVLEHWQRLPAINKIEKETEMRRLRWRNKIWELLPDYTPAAES